MQPRLRRTLATLAVLARASAGAAAIPGLAAPVLPATPFDQDHGLRGTAPYDRGLSVYFCPRRARHARLRAGSSSTSHAGWPSKECLKMDKGPGGRGHV